MKMTMTKQFIWLLLFSTLSALAFAQKTSDKTNMMDERNQIQRELKQIELALSSVKGQQKETLTQLASLNRKIELQEKYINNIGKEIRLINDDIYYSALEISRLKKQLDTLKSHYARSVVYAYKNRTNYDYLNFIFSSRNFNDALKRITYLKSYRDYRAKQMGDIVKTQDLITKRREQQAGSIQKKESALESRSQEFASLELQKGEKDSVVTLLKSQAGDLQKQIAIKQKRDRELRSSISSIVRKEIDEARKAAREDARTKAEAERKAWAEAVAKQQKEAERTTLADAKARDVAKAPTPVAPPAETPDDETYKPANLPKSTKVNAGAATNIKEVPASGSGNLTARNVSINPIKASPPPPPPPVENKAPTGGYLNYKPADVALNSDFSQNRGRLPSPVDGVITLGFGRYRIEGMGPDIVGDNPGVTYTAPVGAPVRAIFEGDVASVSNVGGMSLVVIRHGKYFTAYSNLSSATVNKGSRVIRGQTIGHVGADEETGNGKLDFILMIEERNVDPRAWLAR